MSKIIYIANITLPSQRAHGIQIMKTCEALFRNGKRLELWITSRRKLRKDVKNSGDIADFYGIKNKFPIKKLPVLEIFPKKWKLYFYFETVSFLAAAFFALLREKEEFKIYTRDESVLFLGFLIKKKIFWEAHLDMGLRLFKKARLKKVAGIVAISESLRKIIIGKYKIKPKKITVVHDAVDLEEFGNFLPKDKARELLDMSQDKKIAVYVGSIMKKKGIFVLLDAAAMTGSDWVFEVVGGFAGDESEKAKKYAEEKRINNVIFRGYATRNEIAKYLSAADALVIPNSGFDKESSSFTSPLKLFEYMSSDRPIVASATPTIMEILNPSNAVLVEPDSPQALRDGLNKISRDAELANYLAENSKKDVKNYTWQERAKKIIEFIKI